MMNRDYEPLKGLYAFYAEFSKGFAFACASGCSACCTVNVAVTSLEASYTANAIASSKKFPQGLHSITDAYTPTTTINRNTWELLRGQEPTEDTGVHGDGTCPLLNEEGLCSVYEARPFACRAMSSTVQCSEGGSAVMEPFLITINLAMYQVIEHLDSSGGVTGNLSALLYSQLKNGSQNDKVDHQGKFLKNCTLPGFVVPPDEKLRFRSFLRRLQAWETETGRPLSHWLPEEIQIF